MHQLPPGTPSDLPPPQTISPINSYILRHQGTWGGGEAEKAGTALPAALPRSHSPQELPLLVFPAPHSTSPPQHLKEAEHSPD